MTTVKLRPASPPPVTDPSISLRIHRAAEDTNTVLWRDMIRTMRQPDMLAFAAYSKLVYFLVLKLKNIQTRP